MLEVGFLPRGDGRERPHEFEEEAITEREGDVSGQGQTPKRHTDRARFQGPFDLVVLCRASDPAPHPRRFDSRLFAPLRDRQRGARSEFVEENPRASHRLIISRRFRLKLRDEVGLEIMLGLGEDARRSANRRRPSIATALPRDACIAKRLHLDPQNHCAPLCWVEPRRGRRHASRSHCLSR